MKIYLIRHGRTAEHEANLSQREESLLSEGGKTEVSKLKPEYAKIPFSKIYYSPFERAKETAKLLFGDTGIPMEELPYIHETRNKPAHLEGVSYDEVRKFWDENSASLYLPEWKPEGGESFLDIKERGKKLKEIFSGHGNEETIGVVSHGNFLRFFVGLWLMGDSFSPQVFVELLRYFIVENVGYILLEFDKEAGKVKMLRWHRWE